MEHKNCPNCAAPYDVSLNKCPYCGTSYFDMSCIDIDGLEPFYLKIRTDGLTITAKVIASMDGSVEVSSDYTGCWSWDGSVHSILTSRHADFDLHFTTVRDYGDKNNTLFSITKYED